MFYYISIFQLLMHLCKCIINALVNCNIPACIVVSTQTQPMNITWGAKKKRTPSRPFRRPFIPSWGKRKTRSTRFMFKKSRRIRRRIVPALIDYFESLVENENEIHTY